ncbi:hypothetical protein lerEdw1_010001 [Lerista edwardsae]|nr:hypothetical protein lerEdw1_010001 [Lerista edwardsae]
MTEWGSRRKEGVAPFEWAAGTGQVTGPIEKPPDRNSNIDQQMALLQDGFLGSLYLGLPHCPHPVLRWLFQGSTLSVIYTNTQRRVQHRSVSMVSQLKLCYKKHVEPFAPWNKLLCVPLMSFNMEVSADAFRVLWEISARQLASADDVSPSVWCPKLQDIAQAFYNLGACESALNPAGLVQLEFRHKDLQ